MTVIPNANDTLFQIPPKSHFTLLCTDRLAYSPKCHFRVSRIAMTPHSHKRLTT